MCVCVCVCVCEQLWCMIVNTKGKATTVGPAYFHTMCTVYTYAMLYIYFLCNKMMLDWNIIIL